MEPKIIIFYHSGGQYNIDNRNQNDNYKFFKKTKKTGLMLWNSYEHKRKFIKIKGDCIINTDHFKKNLPLVFWTEWEAESIFQLVNTNDIEKPQHIHIPILVEDYPYSMDKFFQNTDPFVFGKNFIYSNCRQLQFSSLKNLAPYSLILFGSKVNHKFVLDTLFVVKNKFSYNSNNIDNLKQVYKSSLFEKVVLQPILQFLKNHTLSLYEGVSYYEKEKFDGIFSFVPCKIYKSPNYLFKRLELSPEKFPEIYSKNGNISGQGIKIIDSNKEQIQLFWKRIYQELFNNDLCAGISFHYPAIIPYNRINKFF
ncbi:MAG: hypothetical protein KatS3mg129_1375 [Leptospiraceae bacterium]|nr:MAG: hypothetical protein KatS3mg129_1375 [Leptospiraceae bacterium]